jgi:hypothetical protein
MNCELKNSLKKTLLAACGLVLVPVALAMTGCEQSSTSKEINHVNQTATEQKQQIDQNLKVQQDRAVDQKAQIDLNAKTQKTEIEHQADADQHAAQNKADADYRRADNLQKAADQQRDQATRDQNNVNNVR